MPRYPLHRSLIFWSGLAGWVILLGMMVDSCYHRTRIRLSTPEAAWDLESSSFYLSLTHMTGPAGLSTSSIDGYREPQQAGFYPRNLFAAPKILREAGLFPSTMYAMPYGHILLLYLVPWLLLIRWRRNAWRRYHAALNGSLAADGEEAGA